MVLEAHINPFIVDDTRPVDNPPKLTWRAASLARLQRVPEAFREQVRVSVETYARENGATVIEGDIAEAAFVASRKNMCPVDHGEK